MFKRDPVSKIIINSEDSYYKSIVARRQDLQKNQELECEITDLRDELTSIKSLLQQILDGQNNG
jgi:hypothetical protein